MKLGLIPLVAVAAIAPSVTAPAPVTTLAMDGGKVAFATASSGGDCDRVRIWSTGTDRIVRLGRTTSCVATSTGHGIAALSIAGSRVLWLHFVGGNIREWSLFTATLATPRPKRLRFIARDVDEPPPIVLGEGDSGRSGDILPYAVEDEVIALHADGSRRFSWRAPGRVLALDSRAGRLAVAYAGGHVAVLDLAGRMVTQERFAGEVQAVEVGDALVVQYGRTVELRDRFGSKTWQLPAGARLRDSTIDGRIYYVVRGSVRELSSAGPSDRFVSRGTDVQVEGLFLAVADSRRVRLIERR